MNGHRNAAFAFLSGIGITLVLSATGHARELAIVFLILVALVLIDVMRWLLGIR